LQNSSVQQARVLETHELTLEAKVISTRAARIANSNQEPDRSCDLGEFHFGQDGDQAKASDEASVQ
jgi:hypothetical protein